MIILIISELFFLDLKKAFDSVCLKILLRKLDHYGLCDPVNELLDCYLLKHQFVSLNNTHSTIRLNQWFSNLLSLRTGDISKKIWRPGNLFHF